MALNNDELDRRAEELVNAENKHNREVKFEKELGILLNSLKVNGAELKEVQLEIQKLVSKKLGKTVPIPFEMTEEMLNDPQSIGDLDMLEEMKKYYGELYENAYDLAHTSRRFGERHFNAKISKPYLKAYDLSSKMSAQANSFYNKYKDLIEERQAAEEAAEAEENVQPTEPEAVNPVPPTEVEELPLDPKPEDEKPEAPKKKAKTPSLLKNIDPKYYGPIFNLLNTTIVIGNKYKYNTLDYIEYELEHADLAKMQELGFPIDDPKKSEEIKKICLRLVKESKEIRKDQWMTQSNENKKGKFEGRKHSAQEAIVDRNTRLLKKFRISPELAAQYGFVTTLEDVKKEEGVKEPERALVTSVKDDPIFADFYAKFKTIYKLGSPSSESDDVLYKVHKDLQQKENAFGLTGESLKAAKVLVEKTILARRNSWQNGTAESKQAIEEVQKDLGL